MNDIEQCVMQNFCTFTLEELEAAKKRLDSQCYSLTECHVETAIKYVELLASIIADHSAYINKERSAPHG